MRKWIIRASAALLAAGSAAAIAAPVPAAGASVGAPAQPGSWGQGGWQGGTTTGAPYVPSAYGHAPMAMPPHGHVDYRRYARGQKLPRAWRGDGYAVGDWRGWGFAPPGPGMRWVRYYDDAMLIDMDGRVIDALYGVDWSHPRGGYAGGGYAGGPAMAGAAYGAGYAPPPMPYPAPPPGPMPGTTRYRAGPNTVVTTTVTPVAPALVYAGGGYGYAGGAVVSVTPGMAVTTTTTTTDYETVYRSVAVKRRAVRRPARRPIHRRCVQTTCPVLGS